MRPSIIVVGCHGQYLELHINILLYFIFDQNEPNPKGYGNLFMVRNVLWLDDNVDLVQINSTQNGTRQLEFSQLPRTFLGLTKGSWHVFKNWRLVTNLISPSPKNRTWLKFSWCSLAMERLNLDCNWAWVYQGFQLKYWIQWHLSIICYVHIVISAMWNMFKGVIKNPIVCIFN